MKRSYIQNIFLLLSSLIVSFLLIEIALRIILFSDIGLFKKQRLPELYADEYTDEEHWKLYYTLNKEEYIHPVKKKPDKARGGLSDDSKYRSASYINNRRPVLLYGDSFTGCYSIGDCFEHILNSDEAFSKNHFLLNYGMGGYGVDQIYLHFKNSVDKYNNPFVVMSLMTLDLDRSILSFRDGPKPYFTIENDQLKLHESPVYPNIETLIANNKPQITSYFYRRILHSGLAKKYLPNQLISYLKNEDYLKNKTKQINEKILLETIKELKSRNIDYVFLIFHPGWIRGEGALNKNTTDWRSAFIKKILDENKVPYIWSKDIILQNMKAENLTLDDFFIKGDGHPTAHQRKILSEKIKEIVLNSRLAPKIDNKN